MKEIIVIGLAIAWFSAFGCYLAYDIHSKNAKESTEAEIRLAFDAGYLADSERTALVLRGMADGPDFEEAWERYRRNKP